MTQNEGGSSITWFEVDEWLLETGDWNDDGAWIDGQVWQDSPIYNDIAAGDRSVT